MPRLSHRAVQGAVRRPAVAGRLSRDDGRGRDVPGRPHGRGDPSGARPDGSRRRVARLRGGGAVSRRHRRPAADGRAHGGPRGRGRRPRRGRLRPRRRRRRGVLLRVRNGKLVAREHRLLEGVEGAADGDVLSAYLAGSYLKATDRARELLLPFEFEDLPLVAAALAESGQIRIPQRGPQARAAGSGGTERAPSAGGVQVGRAGDRRAGGGPGLRTGTRTRPGEAAALHHLL